jgi:hypothetical protein
MGLSGGLPKIYLGDGSMPSTEKVTQNRENYPIRKPNIVHYQDHAPSFVKEVPAQICQECPGWVHGPPESHPCDCRGSVNDRAINTKFLVFSVKLVKRGEN